MRVLIISTPVSTHLAPLIPLAWGLRAAGHQVLVAGQPDVVGTARDGGLSVAVVGEAFHVTDVLMGGLPPGLRPVQAVGRPEPAALGAATRVWTMHARYVLGPYLELARRWRPDLVVSDRLEYAALLVGGALGVPVVQHRWGIDVIATAGWAGARRAMTGPARRLGLDALPEPALVLDPAPAVLQSPDADPAVPVRYVPCNGVGTVPAWAHRPTRPRRVCVTLGRMTLDLNGAGLLRTVVEAFRLLPDVEGLVTVGAEHRGCLEQVPDNVSVVDPAPLDLFLDTCDAIVHHGGSGTCLTAAAIGLPQLVLPQLLDMFEVGDRVVAAGVGLSLDDAARQDDPADVAGALGRLLDDPAFGRAATALAADVARMPAPGALVPRLEELAAATDQRLAG